MKFIYFLVVYTIFSITLFGYEVSISESRQDLGKMFSLTLEYYSNGIINSITRIDLNNDGVVEKLNVTKTKTGYHSEYQDGNYHLIQNITNNINGLDVSYEEYNMVDNRKISGKMEYVKDHDDIIKYVNGKMISKFNTKEMSVTDFHGNFIINRVGNEIDDHEMSEKIRVVETSPVTKLILNAVPALVPEIQITITGRIDNSNSSTILLNYCLLNRALLFTLLI